METPEQTRPQRPLRLCRLRRRIQHLWVADALYPLAAALQALTQKLRRRFRRNSRRSRLTKAKKRALQRFMAHLATTQHPTLKTRIIPTEERITGCLWGLMCGDALGAPIEFKSPAALAEHYPQGVHGMVQGWGSTARLVPGEITDDSEMAIALLESLVREGGFFPERVLTAYREWLAADPADVGVTIYNALATEQYDPESQANGALMRVAPLAMWGALHPEADVLSAAVLDARLTHIHPQCSVANAVYTGAVRDALCGLPRRRIYENALKRAEISPDIHAVLLAAAEAEPTYRPFGGWLRHALQAAFYWLLHAESYEQALCAIVNRLGDPDTNGAIAGALLGAYFGINGIPAEWRQTVLTAPTGRPERYSPRRAAELTEQLLANAPATGRRGDL